MFAISLPAFVLTMGAGLAFAAFDVIRKRAAHGIEPARLLVVQLIGQLPIFAIWVLLSGDYRLATDYFGLGLLAVGIGVAANRLFLKALQRSSLSGTIPILSLTPVFTCVFAAWFLDEYPTTVQAVGIGLVCLGVLMLNLRSASEPASQIVRRWTGDRGALLMVIVALLWSVNGPIHKQLLEYTSVPLHALIQLTASSSVLLIWLAAARKLRSPRPSRGDLSWAVAASAVGGLAYGLQLLAFGVTPVAIVESVKRVIGQISALTFGRFAFRESVTVAKTGAVATLCMGVPLILLPI